MGVWRLLDRLLAEKTRSDLGSEHRGVERPARRSRPSPLDPDAALESLVRVARDAIRRRSQVGADDCVGNRHAAALRTRSSRGRVRWRLPAGRRPPNSATTWWPRRRHGVGLRPNSPTPTRSARRSCLAAVEADRRGLRRRRRRSGQLGSRSRGRYRSACWRASAAYRPAGRGATPSRCSPTSRPHLVGCRPARALERASPCVARTPRRVRGSRHRSAFPRDQCGDKPIPVRLAVIGYGQDAALESWATTSATSSVVLVSKQGRPERRHASRGR